MHVEEGSDSSSCAVTRDQERVRSTVWVLLKQLPEAAGDRNHHLASDRKEAGVAKVVRVILIKVRITRLLKRTSQMRTKKPDGDAGSVLRLTVQSINVAVPRMEKTIVFM